MVVANALLKAHRDCATGRLRVRKGGRESHLLLRNGELVGVRLGFAYRGAAQALWIRGKLSPSIADSLWARGEFGRWSEEVERELGLARGEGETEQLLEGIRHLNAQAEAAEFESEEVTESPCQVPAQRYMRALFEHPPQDPKAYRCPDLQSAEDWALGEEERAFLSGLADFSPLDPADPKIPLLALLESQGLAESMPLSEWEDLQAERERQRQKAELERQRLEAKRHAELERRRVLAEQEAERARRAELERRLEEERQAEFTRQAELEQQRRLAEQQAELARQEEEARRVAWAQQDQAAQSRMLEQAWNSETGFQEAVEELSQPWTGEQISPESDLPEIAVGDLVVAEPVVELSPADIDAAAASAPSPEEDSWFTAGTPPFSPKSAGPAPAQAPLIFGPQSQSGADLARDISVASSFQEALQQAEPELLMEEVVEGTLEAPVEAVIEASWDMAIPDSGRAQQGGALAEWGLGENLSGAESVDAAKTQRQRLLQRAMETLAPQPESAAPSRDAGAVAAEIDARFAQVQAQAAPHVLLGLPPLASKEQLKQAFVQLAKVFHPDRLPPALARSHQAKVTTVYEAIRRAYESLSQTAPAAVASPAAAAPRIQGSASDLLQKGEALFRKRDFRAAEACFEKAHQLAPSAALIAARAWAIYMDPTRKAENEVAKQLMADALGWDPNCDRAHYQLGVVARLEGKGEEAERHFRQALRSNPSHLEANQELRLIDLRKKGGPPKH